MPRPAKSPEQLRRRLLQREAMLKLRNQVGDRDVDEAARRDHEEIGKHPLPRPDDEVPDDAADDRGESREGVEEERAATGKAGVEQNDVVADFLRDLVGDDGQRRLPCRHAYRQGRRRR